MLRISKNHYMLSTASIEQHNIYLFLFSSSMLLLFGFPFSSFSYITCCTIIFLFLHLRVSIILLTYFFVATNPPFGFGFNVPSLLTHCSASKRVILFHSNEHCTIFQQLSIPSSIEKPFLR